MAAINKELTEVISYSDFLVRHLGVRTRNLLSRYLNVNLKGKDWRDVADELEYDYLTILNWEQNKDPMGCLLLDWGTKESSTVGKLVSTLTYLEREDVVSEIQKPVERDYQLWKEREAKADLESNSPLQVNEISDSRTSYPYLPETEELRGITLGDRPSGPIETFDAYVCFCDADRDIVFTMMRLLEKPPYNLKLCVEFRDLVPGTAYVTATAELITNRCKRLIVILSPEFLKSEACDFQAKVALSYAPGARAKHIIPVMYKQCVIPPMLRHIALCDYTKKDQQEWFWERLFCALNLK